MFRTIGDSKFFKYSRGLPWRPSGKASPSNAEGTGSTPGEGAKIPYALQPKNQNKTEAIV